MKSRDKTQRNSNHREEITEGARMLTKIFGKKRFTGAVRSGSRLRR